MAQANNPTVYELCLMHARADRVLRSLVSSQLERQGLTLMQWLVLGVVCDAPRGGISMSEIAETLDVTLPQVTALVNSLVEAKYIKQKVLARDHRGRQVMPTLKAKRVLMKLQGGLTKSIRAWTSNVPSDELKAYYSALFKLSQ